MCLVTHEEDKDDTETMIPNNTIREKNQSASLT